jgi:hypothetical protein
MSRAKQMSDVEDTSHRQTTHGSVGPTDPFGVVHRGVNHRFISLRSFALDRKVSKKFRIFQENYGFSTQGQVFVRKDIVMGEI